MDQEPTEFNSADTSGAGEAVSEIHALIKQHFIDFGVEIVGDIRAKSKLTILASVKGPEAFKDTDIAITISESDKPFSEIISRSLSGLPRRLQNHLYEPGYKFLGIIFWRAGRAMENPPPDYNTLYMQSSVDIKTFDSFCKLLLENSQENTKRFVNIKAVALESDKFVKHEVLSVGITGIDISIQCDTSPD